MLLSGVLYLNGTISAKGGIGGDALSGPSSGTFAQAGGGGGGGRIKLVGSAQEGAGFTTVVTGGAGGVRAGTGYAGADAVAGSDGTVSDTTTAVAPEVVAAPVTLQPAFTG